MSCSSTNLWLQTIKHIQHVEPKILRTLRNTQESEDAAWIMNIRYILHTHTTDKLHITNCLQTADRRKDKHFLMFLYRKSPDEWLHLSKYISEVLQPKMDLGCITVEVSRSCSYAHTPSRTPLNRWSAHPRGHLHSQHITSTRDEHPCPHWGSILQFQQPSRWKPMHQTARPIGLAYDILHEILQKQPTLAKLNTCQVLWLYQSSAKKTDS
jgi:hypothetical protein